MNYRREMQITNKSWLHVSHKCTVVIYETIPIHTGNNPLRAVLRLAATPPAPTGEAPRVGFDGYVLGLRDGG